jgi:hypothetical protein
MLIYLPLRGGHKQLKEKLHTLFGVKTPYASWCNSIMAFTIARAQPIAGSFHAAGLIGFIKNC